MYFFGKLNYIFFMNVIKTCNNFWLWCSKPCAQHAPQPVAPFHLLYLLSFDRLFVTRMFFSHISGCENLQGVLFKAQHFAFGEDYRSCLNFIFRKFVRVMDLLLEILHILYIGWIFCKFCGFKENEVLWWISVNLQKLSLERLD